MQIQHMVLFVSEHPKNKCEQQCTTKQNRHSVATVAGPLTMHHCGLHGDTNFVDTFLSNIDTPNVGP